MYKEKDHPKDKLLTINQVSEQLGVSMDTLRKWDRSGKLKAIQFVARSPRRYKKEDIEKWINK